MKTSLVVVCAICVMFLMVSMNAGAVMTPRLPVTVSSNVTVDHGTTGTQEFHVGNAFAAWGSATGAGLDPHWELNGVPLVDGPAAGGGTISGAGDGTPGSGTFNLAIDVLGVADSGVYTLVVNGTCSSDTSLPITVTVYPVLAPTIAGVQQYCPGVGNVIDLTAGVGVPATGKAPYTYAWYADYGSGNVALVDSGPLSPGGGTIAGATTNHLTITSPGVADTSALGYQCDVNETPLVNDPDL